METEMTRMRTIVIARSDGEIEIHPGSEPMPYMITEEGKFFRPTGRVYEGGFVYEEWTPEPGEVDPKLGEGCLTMHYPVWTGAVFLP